MVYGVSSSNSMPSYFHEDDYQRVRGWADEIGTWDIPGQSKEFVQAIQTELESYLSGDKGNISASQVQRELFDLFFNPRGNLDVYMMSGLSEPGAVESVMKIFGLVPPPPTPMDVRVMNFLNHFPQFPPSALLSRLLDEMLYLGSGASMAQLEKWANQMLQDRLYTQSSPEIQLLFRQHAGL